MKILVIEDRESIRSFLRSALEAGDHEVVTAESGAEGIKIFREGGDFSIVWTDHDMPPGMNGEQVIAEIRRLKLRQPVVLFTANKELLIRLEKTPGDYLFLKKPATLKQIYAKIAEAINS